jgi:hypothetical protein
MDSGRRGEHFIWAKVFISGAPIKSYRQKTEMLEK